MKAGEDLVIIRNKDGTTVPYKEGDSKDDLTFTTIKKGKEIPKEFLKRYVEHNIEKIGDVIYKDSFPINLPKDLEVPAPVAKEMKIKKRKYSQDSLYEIYNDKEKGFSALKKIGEEFGVTDRSSRRLIVEILRAQEERQRAGL